MLKKSEQRARRHRRIRSNVAGTAERPRLAVFRSTKHIYAQVINDDTGTTLAFAGTLSKDVKDAVKESNKIDAAKKVGAAIAKACMAKGVSKVVFDRGGYRYHGRITALANAAREAGLQF